MSTWVVYVVRCRDGSLYTGMTNRLAERLRTHNAGHGAKYTRSRRPVELVWSECAVDATAARKREAEIKRWTRAQKLSLLAS